MGNVHEHSLERQMDRIADQAKEYGMSFDELNERMEKIQQERFGNADSMIETSKDEQDMGAAEQDVPELG